MSVAIKQDYLPFKHVINHDIMNCTAEGVVGNHLYSGRALGISQPWDIIQLHPHLKYLWQAIIAHYQRIGLRHSHQVIWDLDLHHIGAHVGYHASVFYFGIQECRYWGDSQYMETVEFINSKNNFMQLAEQLGVDVPKTQGFESSADIDNTIIDTATYPCYLKAAISVSGVGIYRCEDKTALRYALSQFDKDTPLQLQEEIITDIFLNLQYQIVGDTLYRLTASEQILDGFVHQGNRVPARYAPWESVDPMAYWLKDQGMKGIFAFDVAVMQTDRGLRFPAIECNPRFNGASYPTLIAEKLAIRNWSAISVSTKHRSLAEIDLEGIEFNKNTGEGVVMINWGTILVGKLTFLLAGSDAYQQAVTIELMTRL